MARYFGGFRDRLKKRSKHVPVSEKDIDWVKVATTFSWSPAKRDYQWLEPEDYLSSFLNGSQADDGLESAFQGDGSMDALGVVPLPHEVDEADLYTPEPPPPIAYEPPYDFALPEAEEAPPAFEEAEIEPPPVQAEDTLLRLRPEIDVQAELPMLEEYKLEIVSALQRRGRHIKAEEIDLPENLEQQLAAYHGSGDRTVDSYKLRDKLQKFKQQLIDSHDQFSSGGPLSGFQAQQAALEVDKVPQESDADYESYILNSLNRLEATMGQEVTPESEEQEGEQTFTGAIPQGITPYETQTDDESGFQEDAFVAEINDETDTLDQDSRAGRVIAEEPPSSFADDSWLVLPVDTDKQNDNSVESGHHERANHLIEDEEESPDLAGLRADNDELLKALNTISSRFPEQDSEAKRPVSKSLFKKTGAKDETDAQVRKPFFREQDIDAVIRPEQDSLSATKGTSGFTDDEQVTDKSLHEKESSSAPGAAPFENADLDAFIPENEAIKADETSLSDLLLQLRNERDDGIKSGSKVPPASKPQNVTTKPPIEKAAVKPEDVKERIEFVSNQPGQAEKDEPLELSEKTHPIIDQAAVDENTEQTVPEENSKAADLKRAKFIEDERKKLYSLIGKLERDRTEATTDAGDEAIANSEQKATGPADDASPREEITTPSELESNQTAEDKLGYSMLDASVISEITETMPIQQFKETPPTTFEAEETLLTIFDGPEETSDIDLTDDLSKGLAENPNAPLVSDESESDVLAEPEVTLRPIGNPVTVETKSTEKSLMDEVQGAETDNLEAVTPIKPEIQETAATVEKPVFDDQPELIRPAKEDFVMPQPRIDKAAKEQEDMLVEPVEDTATSEKEVVEAKEVDTHNESETATEMLAESSVPVETEIEKEAEPVVDTGLIEADEMLSGEASLEAVIETLAFAAEDPIPVKRIARIYAEMQGVKLPSGKEMEAAIDRINADYEESGRAFRIKNWGGGIRMASHPQYARFIRALYEEHRPKKLSRTLMETLAIISYSQPTTKPEIDFVRGVDSDYAVRKLLEIGLIDIVGRSESIGRPLLYGTSERFLEQFGLSSLEALPKLREVEELLGDPAFKKERLHLLALEGMEEAAQAIDNGQDAASSEDQPDAEKPSKPAQD